MDYVLVQTTSRYCTSLRNSLRTIIYFVIPSPAGINNLELLPVLLEVICSSNSQKCSLSSPKLTPHAASLMIINVLITTCDYATNNRHLEAISSTGSTMWTTKRTKAR